jgi:hypothetical protein
MSVPADGVRRSEFRGIGGNSVAVGCLQRIGPCAAVVPGSLDGSFLAIGSLGAGGASLGARGAASNSRYWDCSIAARASNWVRSSCGFSDGSTTPSRVSCEECPEGEVISLLSLSVSAPNGSPGTIRSSRTDLKASHHRSVRHGQVRAVLETEQLTRGSP